MRKAPHKQDEISLAKPTRSPINTQIPATLKDNLPWGLLLFTTGIGIYFSLPIEGGPKPTAALLTLMSLAWFVSQKTNPLQTLITMLLITLLGYSAALYRTYSVQSPQLPEASRTYHLTLKVEEAMPISGNRVRYIGKPLSLSRTPNTNMPKRVRITTPDKGTRYVFGDQICMKAVLSRPKGPLRPGGYDLGWVLWFQKIGATGFTISTPYLCKIGKKQKENTISLLIARTKEAIAGRLDKGLASRERALARALILGDRGRIEKTDLTALRSAGLGHLLAISGLHMAVFAGTLFFLVRAGLACFPTIAEQYPIKKWAALIALAGGGVYFLISGQSIPTQRAYIMIAIVFLAICLERPALTLRNVVLAAMVILALKPESLFNAGFQMSFAAVTALIVTYQLSLKYNPLPRPTYGSAHTLWQKPLYYIVGIWLTSLVATLATAPYTLYHFHQVSYLGPLGNMMAIPIFSFLVMPLAVICLCAMPLGLEALPLKLLSSAIDLLLQAAHWTASFKPAMLTTGEITITSLVFFTLAGLTAIFLTGKGRWASLALLTIAVFMAKPTLKPDLYISAKGDLMALRGKDNKLHAPTGQQGRYVLMRLLKADGDHRHAKAARKTSFVKCDESACSGTVKGLKVTLLRHIKALEEECAQADILIYKHIIHRPCQHPKLILSKSELQRGGAQAIYIRDGKIHRIEANHPRRHRLWGRVF